MLVGYIDFLLCVYLGFGFCAFFHVVVVLLAFVVSGLVSSVLSQGIGWEHLRNDLFGVEWNFKP